MPPGLKPECDYPKSTQTIKKNSCFVLNSLIYLKELRIIVLFIYLCYEYIPNTEWFWIGFGLVLVPSLFRYINHLTFIYSQFICHISIKVYGIYFGNK
jgi:hypothetical protein